MSVENKTNEQLLTEVQLKIIVRGENPYYPVEQHLRDMELIADLSALRKKI